MTKYKVSINAGEGPVPLGIYGDSPKTVPTLAHARVVRNKWRALGVPNKAITITVITDA